MEYNHIQGWFNWHGIYDKMAREVPEGGTIVELGVWKGRSLVYLASKITELNKNVRLVGVDKFDATGHPDYEILRGPESLYAQTATNLVACGYPWVELIKSDAVEAASHFKDNSVNFIFVDDLHTPDHVRLELDAWIPKLIKPTWIAGDDYSLVAKEIDRRFTERRFHSGCWIANIL
jgi:cephalosporin hydroxylase